MLARLLAVLALGGCGGFPSEPWLAPLSLPEGCAWVDGSGADDLWCLAVDSDDLTSATPLYAFHFDGKTWTQVASPTIPSAAFDFASAGPGAVWAIASSLDADGTITALEPSMVLRIDKGGAVEDHSGEVDTNVSTVIGHDGFAILSGETLSIFQWTGQAFAKLTAPGTIAAEAYDVRGVDDLWTCIDGTSGNLAHFDGAAWTSFAIPCAGATFGGPQDGWAVDGSGGLDHFDGTAWQPQTLAMPSTLGEAIALGAGRLAFFTMTQDTNTGDTDFTARIWDGATLTPPRILLHLAHYCVGTDDAPCGQLPMWTIGAPLADGSLPTIIDSQNFLLSPDVLR